MLEPRVAVLTGFGLNCENETAYVFDMAGAVSELIHINDLIAGNRNLADYQILALIGGFAFGDHISSGRILTIKLKYRLFDQLNEFLSGDKLIIGICNGFQTLVKLGILPGGDRHHLQPGVTLIHNQPIGYRDDWVRVRFNPQSPCLFTRGIEQMDIPIRHGEGRFLYASPEIRETIMKNNQIVMQYIDPATGLPTQSFPHNPNGATDAVAGICDPSGRIFGLMPHPEVFHSIYNHPRHRADYRSSSLEGDGMKIFRNAVRCFH
ncbi:MAG: phosphoribosylformylglycinamidine synthase subunit PurQ [Candidatus Delongbacteria bacterium]|nr:phosphoribosylformylglycinamidine synthase subunit PurQ [Candidatus Delongbacteria bacterium]